MYITFKELRDLKFSLPEGSVARIAKELNMDEQTVRNYFGAKKYEDGQIKGIQLQPGPDGGIVHIEDTRIIDLAKKIIGESSSISEQLSPIRLIVNPGTAPSEVIADILSDISIFYRKTGGSGINFTFEDIKINNYASDGI